MAGQPLPSKIDSILASNDDGLGRRPPDRVPPQCRSPDLPVELA